MGVNNLPKVVTRQCGGRGSNLRPATSRMGSVQCSYICLIRDWSRHRRSRDRDRDNDRRVTESVRKVFNEDKFKGSLSEGQHLTIELDSDEE